MGCLCTKKRQLAVAEDVLQRETRELFDAVDDDGNGVLGFSEIRGVLDSANVHYNPKDLANIINLYDNDGDGTLSFKEFHKLLRGQIHDRAENLVNLFQAYDRDRDGYIFCEECERLFSNVGVSNDVLQRDLAKFFPTPTSKIRFEQFCMIFAKFV